MAAKRVNANDPTAGQTWSAVWSETIWGMLIWLWDGFILMRAFTVAHEVSPSIPAFGYCNSVFFAWVVWFLIAGGTFNLTQRVKRLGELVAKGPVVSGQQIMKIVQTVQGGKAKQ